MIDLSLDDDDDLLDLDLEDDILDLGPAEVLYDLLPAVQFQVDFCRAYASLHPLDDLELEAAHEEFHFWWAKYQKDSNIKALEMAYLRGRLLKSLSDKPGLCWKNASHPEFPGAVMPAEILSLIHI